MIERRDRFEATASRGAVSSLVRLPESARALYVLAHGAGAGMDHPFLEAMSESLAAEGVGTFRFNFPYKEAGRRAPDRHPVLKETIRSAVAAAALVAPGLPLLAGGKSMGGRMTSLAHAEDAIPGIKGLVFLGFPLHAPGKRGSERGAHLADVALPMLFLQGTRDRLADLSLLEPLLSSIGERATLHVVDGGDHSFTLPKRLGREPAEVHGELAGAIAGWVDRI